MRVLSCVVLTPNALAQGSICWASWSAAVCFVLACAMRCGQNTCALQRGRHCAEWCRVGDQQLSARQPMLRAAAHTKSLFMQPGLYAARRFINWPGASIGPALYLCCAALCCFLQGAVWSCVLDSTATLAATGSADFSAKIWDALTGLEKASLQHKHIVRTCCFAPCSTKLSTGGEQQLDSLRLVAVAFPCKQRSGKLDHWLGSLQWQWCTYFLTSQCLHRHSSVQHHSMLPFNC